jgi:transposase
MIKIKFTKEEIEQLNFEKVNCTNSRVRIKLEALILKANGLPNKKIQQILNIDKNTVTAYLKLYVEGGLESVKKNNYLGPTSELEQYAEIIFSDFEINPPATIKEASYRIEQLTGIKRGKTQTWHFLKKKQISLSQSRTSSSKS